MPRCEDFPCCGHIEPDGSNYCPDEDGRFPCALCNSLLPKGVTSSICKQCIQSRQDMDPDERDMMDDRGYDDY